METKNKTGNKLYYLKRTIDIILALALVCGVFYGIKKLGSGSSEISNSRLESDLIAVTDPSSAASENQIIYTNSEINNSDVYKGALIVVNKEIKYQGTEKGLVSIYDEKNKIENSDYSVKDMNVKIRKEAMDSLNKMMSAFTKKTGHDDIQIISAYRSEKRQKELYEENKGNGSDTDLASKPGYSEHQTGYAIDINIINEDGSNVDFDGKGDYSWFAENSYKYGFILRYPEDKTKITGNGYEPWHFRYVGKVHANYMHENNLSLEEYLELLKNYPYGSLPLEAKDSDGNEYQIYYAVKDSAAETTYIPVPSENEYTLSGNNTDGFIITMNVTEKSENSSTTENNTDNS